MQITCNSPKFHPLILTAFADPCLYQLLWLSNLAIPSKCMRWCCAVRKRSSSTSGPYVHAGARAVCVRLRGLVHYDFSKDSWFFLIEDDIWKLISGLSLCSLPVVSVFYFIFVTKTWFLNDTFDSKRNIHFYSNLLILRVFPLNLCQKFWFLRI